MPALTGKAFLVLESLQKKVYSHLQISPPEDRQAESDFSDNPLIDEILAKDSYLSEKERAELKSSLVALMKSEIRDRKLPTQYENPSLYFLMIKLAEEIEEALSAYSMKMPVLPALGTLPTGRVNAMAIAIPNNEYLVVFENQLFIFALLISKVVARAIPFREMINGQSLFSTDEADIERNINENPVIVQRFMELISAYLILGHPGAAPQYILEEPYMRFSSILRDSMELFVMGHEYGHILSGHLSADQLPAHLLGEESVNEIARSWQQELEADAVGLQLLIPAMQKKRGMDLSLSYWGADLFFSCNEVLERGASILNTGQPDQRRIGSHPHAELRRQSLRDVLTNAVPAEQSKGPIALGMVVQKIMNMLWSKTEPSFYKFYEEGVKPALIWQ